MRSSFLRSATSAGKKPYSTSLFIMRALRLSSRSRRRRMARAARRVTAREEPSFGLRPLLKMRTPARMMALGSCCSLSRNTAQPSEVDPKSSAKR